MREEEGVACAAGVEAGVYVEEAVSLRISSASTPEPEHHYYLKPRGEVPY